jgi:hypothetical protein
MRRSQNARRVRPFVVTLLLVTLAPVASADTLAQFQEPARGTDQSWTFTIANDEAYLPHAVIFLNPLAAPSFELSVTAPNGTTVFDHKGQRGIQTLPGLAPEGEYRIRMTGSGTFVMTRHFLGTFRDYEREGNATTVRNATVTDVNRTLQGTEAWFLQAASSWYVHVTGNVSVEWDNVGAKDVAATALHLETPVNQTASSPLPYLLLVRGAPGTRYSIHLDPAPDIAPAPASTTPAAKSPGPGLALVACAALIGAVALRRLRPKA